MTVIHKHVRCQPVPLIMVVILMTSNQTPVQAQTQNDAAVLRGEGAFLRGAGSYNLNTAQATSINVDTVIRWKQDLRKIEAERRDLHARNEAGKKLKIEDVKRRQQMRGQQLRANPTAEDIQTGEALNALLYDLTDPDITSAMWTSRVVELPKGMSVKDLIFRFTPFSGSTNTSKALSRGVIALSLLDTTGDKWPTVMKQAALNKERIAYETTYAKLREQLLGDKLKLETLGELDRSLDSLKAKVQTEIPKDRGFRDEATKFVEDMKNSTRFFDAATVDYAKEILVDTKDNDARTVAELVGFMLKYRLQFASAERSPTGRVLYGQLYELMKQQTNMLGNPTAASNSEPWVQLFNGKDLKGWRSRTDMKNWRVEGGIVVGTGFSVLFTEKDDYVNFHMRAEVMAEGAVLLALRTATKDDHQSYRVRVGSVPVGTDAPKAGTILHTPTARNNVTLSIPKISLPYTPGQWVSWDIIVLSNQITVLQDGKEITKYTDADRLFTRGAVGIICGGKTLARVRKFEIKELP